MIILEAKVANLTVAANKRISYAVMFRNNGKSEFGLIKYFVHNQDNGETYAVIDVPKISNSPPSFSKYAVHYIWLSVER